MVVLVVASESCCFRGWWIISLVADFVGHSQVISLTIAVFVVLSVRIYLFV